VKIPDKFSQEMRWVCKPTNNSDKNPSFVFDYFTMHKEGLKKIDGIYVPCKEEYMRTFCNWIEIKTGKAKLSPNQKKTSMEIKIPFSVFRIHTKFPKEFVIDWETIGETGKIRRIPKF